MMNNEKNKPAFAEIEKELNQLYQNERRLEPSPHQKFSS